MPCPDPMNEDPNQETRKKLDNVTAMLCALLTFMENDGYCLESLLDSACYNADCSNIGDWWKAHKKANVRRLIDGMSLNELQAMRLHFRGEGQTMAKTQKEIDDTGWSMLDLEEATFYRCDCCGWWCCTSEQNENYLCDDCRAEHNGQAMSSENK